jgi:hypothetical protein
MSAAGVRHPGDDPDDLVTVGRFIDPVAAEFARSRLEADGLTCFIQGGGLGSLLPTATMFPIRLEVRAADAERAAEILAEAPLPDLVPGGEAGGSTEGLQQTEEEDAMDLREYFESTEGTGVMATADTAGNVDAAVYSRPHVLEDGTLAFVMRDRLTHHNVGENPHVAYLFLEHGPGYRGKRLFLVKVREERDSPLAEQLRRRHLSPEEDAAKGPKFLVVFRVERELPLIGAGA